MQRRNFKCIPVEAKTLGDHIRLKRLEKGLTQGEAVKLIGVPMKRLSDWERDLVTPSESDWPRVSSTLGLNRAILRIALEARTETQRTLQ
jgi:transcriptional regulator with XRE-family HTH domain